MQKKLPLFVAGSIAGLALIVNALSAADAPASGNTTTPPSMSGNGSMAKPAMPASGNETAAAPKIDLSKLPKPSDKKDLTFAKDIEPIFKASCSGCHYMPTRNASAGLNLTTLESTLKGGKKGKDVVPGKSAESLIVLYTAGAVPKAEMPPLNRRNADHPALTDDQIALIRAWIDEGAK